MLVVSCFGARNLLVVGIESWNYIMEIDYLSSLPFDNFRHKKESVENMERKWRE